VLYGEQPASTAPVTPTMLALLLSLAIVVAYFAFILLVALAKPLLATIIAPGVSLGLIFAAGLLVFCMLASFIFVVMQNRKDGLMEEVV
jgi:uncharacterized membrane protein (DUF485 family)